MARPKPPTKAMLAAIGRVAAECAAVEDELRELLCLLMNSPYARVIAAGEDLSNIALMCRRVARYNLKLTDDDVDALAAICKAVDVLRAERNFLVHARWEKLSTPGEHGGKRSRRVAASSGAGTQEALLWTPAMAEETADHFKTLHEYIEVFIERTFGGPMNHVLWERESWNRFNEAMEATFGDVLKKFAERPLGAGRPPP